MSQSVFGAAAAVTMLNRAFNNSSPANAVFNNQVATAGSTAEGQFAFANTFAASFNTLTDAQLAERVLGNMGVLPNDPLLAAVADYFTATGVASRGTVVLQLGQILAGLETATGEQAIYAPQAAAWNTEVEKSFIYSSNSANTTAYEGDFAPTPVGQGQTFTLTQSAPTGKADNLTGTSQNDLFDGRLPNSLETGDVLTDMGGTDKLEARISVVGVTPTLTGIEELYIQATGAASMNLSKATGYTQLWNQDTNTGIDLTFNSVAAGTTIGLKNIARDAATSTTTVNFTAANATTNVALDGAGTGVAGAGAELILNSNATTVAVSTAGAASRMSSLTANNLTATAATMNTLKVEGTANLRIDNVVNFNAATSAGTVDASAFKGNLNINLTQGGRDLTVTGGEGADRFNLGGTLTTADNVKGGAGRDTLAVTSDATIVAALNTESLEIVEVVSLTNGGTLNLARVNGADSAVITGAQGVAATISGLKSNGSVEFQSGSTAEVTATVTGATNAGTTDTLNVVLNHSGLGQAVNSLAIAGVENVNLSSVKQSAAIADATNVFTGFNTANAPQIQNLTITGDQNLNITGALNPQIKTVNASAFTGDLFVQVLGGVTNNGVAITGGTGDDRILGGSSNDVIVTGEGANTVRGDVLGVVQAGSPQSSTITVSGAVEIGDVFTATVNGTTVTYVAQVATVADVQTGLIAALNNVAAPGVTGNAGVAAAVTAAAGVAAGTIVVTEDVNNGGFAQSVNAANRQATPETSTLTVAAGTYDIGDVITTVVNGTNVVYTVAGTTQTQDQVATGIAAAIQASPGASPVVNATAATNVVTLVSDVPGTAFTLTSTVTTNATATATTTTLTPAGLAATESFSVTIGGTSFSEVFAANVSTTLTNFVANNGAAINLLTGGTLSGLDTDNADADNNPATGTFEAVLITGAGTGVALTGGAISGSIIGSGSVATVSVPGIQVTANTNPVIADNVVVAVTQGADNTQAVAQATTIAGVAQVLGTGGVDAITLGGGSDALQLAAGESGFLSGGVIQVDTVTNINFGGATLSTRADVIDLLANAQQTGLVADNADIAGAAAFGGFNVINGGVAQAAVAAPTLTAAMAAIFNAGGALNGQTNAAGLFTYGGDTFLVIAGGAAGAYSSADDSVIKLVGLTGSLDSTDFV